MGSRRPSHAPEKDSTSVLIRWTEAIVHPSLVSTTQHRMFLLTNQISNRQFLCSCEPVLLYEHEELVLHTMGTSVFFSQNYSSDSGT